MINVLYIHGMGGGGDSRIPSILDSALSEYGVRVIVRTYDFDPEIAFTQICSWVDELEPKLIIGESLGAIHAIRVKGIPHLLISPALNAPFYLAYVFSYVSLIPGMPLLLGRIYKPREGDRQVLRFNYKLLRKYAGHVNEAKNNTPLSGSTDSFHAFIGSRDHYRHTGVVSLRTWKKYFGDTFTIYDGTHFTEEEHLFNLVLPKLSNMLGIE